MERCIPRARAFATLIVFLFVIVCAACNRQIGGLLIPQLKADLGVTDGWIGFYLGTAFFLPAVATSLPLGYLVDTGRRHFILATITATIGACGLVAAASHTATELVLLRMLAGAAFSGLMTCIYAMTSDLFDARARPIAIVAILTAITAGNAISLVLGSRLVEAIGSAGGIPGIDGSSHRIWPEMFAIVALPMLAVSVVVGLFPVPRVRAAGAAEVAPVASLRTFVAANRARVATTFLGLVGAENAIDMTLAWSAEILRRHFGWSTTLAGGWLGSVILASSLSGLAIAALILRKRAATVGLRSPDGIAMTSLCAMVPCFVGMMLTSSGVTFLFLVGALVLFVYLTAAVTPELLIRMAPPALTGRLIALYAVVLTAGAAISPLVVGQLSDFASADGSYLLTTFAAAGVTNAICSSTLFAIGIWSRRRVSSTLRHLVA